MPKITYRTILVIGDNHADIARKYSADLEGNENTGYLSDFKFLDKNDVPLTLTSVRSGENEDGYLYYTYSMKLTKNKDLWNIKYTDTGGQKHFTSSISFDIKTDELLELIHDYKYANYKLKVNAKISKGATAYQNEDYIVYTNAKVNAEYVIDSN